MIEIDGSQGEGGGQVLRTSLSLSAVTGMPCRLTRIRARREHPGLAAQHLAAVRAAAEVCEASISGDRFGSQELIFRPGTSRAGSYTFDVGDIRPSAGSVNLILQTVLPLLARCGGESEVLLRGGTHVSWSPTYDYVAEVFLPAAAEFGVRAEVELHRAGYYPKGNGEERLVVQGGGPWRGADFTTARGERQCRLISRATRLPEHVVQRQLSAMRTELAAVCPEPESRCEDTPGIAPGTAALAATVSGNGGWAGGSALGERGKPAEAVGREAAGILRTCLASGALVDRHLADQLLLYAALASGPTELLVEGVTEHTRTNIAVIQRFLGPRFVEEAGPGRLRRIRCTGEA